MQQYFAEYGLAVPLGRRLARVSRRAAAAPALGVSPLHAGFAWPDGEARVRHRSRALRRGRPARRAATRARRSNVDAMLRDLSEVRIGDPVVHEEHGIGRYLGLVTMDLGEGPTEFLQLVYANDAKLYVPVVEPAPHRPLQRRVAGGRAAARARQRPMGKGEEARGAAGARHGGGAAQPLRAARRAHGPRVQVQRRTTTRRSPRASASRKRRTSRPRSRR